MEKSGKINVRKSRFYQKNNDRARKECMMSKTKKKKKHRLFWHFFRIQLVLLVLVLTAAACYFYGGYGKQVEELRQEAVRLVRQSDVDTFKANQTSIVYASDGSVISRPVCFSISAQTSCTCTMPRSFRLPAVFPSTS